MIHIQGGEESGSIDNIVRDVISTMSMTHFADQPGEKPPENRCRCERSSRLDAHGRLYLKFKLAFKNLNSEINEKFKPK